MPTYARKQLTEYDYKPTTCLQYCPYEQNLITYRKNPDSIVHDIEAPLLDRHKKKYVQQVLGSLVYQVRAIDMTILHALLVIASE